MDTPGPEDKVVLQDWYDLAIGASALYGYYYIDCTTEMLYSLGNAHEIPHADAKHWKPISSDRAVSQFETSLAKPPTVAQQVALKRIKTAWEDPNWTPDVAMKSFFDLDLVYFGGYLRDKCRLQWDRGGTRDTLGWTQFDQVGDVPTAKITLNAEKLFKDAKTLHKVRKNILGTLLHEMIYAYDIARCNGHPRWELGHGEGFQKMGDALKSRMRKDISGFEPKGVKSLKHVPRQRRDGRKGDDFLNPIELD